MHGWIYLSLAIACEICGTTCLKLSQGFTKIVPSVLLFVFYGGTLTAMSMAVKHLEIGVVYAVWSGVGTAVVTLIGIAVFQESLSAVKIFSILLIIAGVVGLQLSGKAPTKDATAWVEKEL
jgi:small multidrug resistance pump